MNHVDEGTIHAWLDGALDAAQAREIEAHVAGCAACSAAVAEARGLIAGASRILGALDEVPAGVIPGAAARTAAASPPIKAPAAPARTAARLKPRGAWRVTRWASGIAAVLVAAIVLSTANKAERTQFRETPRAVVADTRGPVVGAPAAADEATTGTAAPERRELASQAPPPATPAPVADAGTAGRASGAAVTRSAAGNEARKSVPSAAEPSAPSAAVRSFGETAPQRAASAMQQDSTRLARVDPSRVVESVAVTALGTADSAVERFAGCYRIGVAPDSRIGVSKGAVGGADASRLRTTSSRRAEGAAAPSAAADAQKSDFSARGMPSVVRLDTARGQLGYTVRVTSDSAVGSWRIVGDSVRVELGARGVLMLSPAQKVACP